MTTPSHNTSLLVDARYGILRRAACLAKATADYKAGMRANGAWFNSEPAHLYFRFTLVESLDGFRQLFGENHYFDLAAEVKEKLKP